MTALLFAPHGDDETLFAFYQLLRYRPHVVICLYSDSTRVRETVCAMKHVGCSFEQWDSPESNPDWRRIADQIRKVLDRERPTVVIAPAWEEGGHEHHNAVADAFSADDAETVIRYLTYRRGHGRSRNGTEVVADKYERDLKLAALQCYQSQWENPATAPWFPGGEYGTYQEWVA